MSVLISLQNRGQRCTYVVENDKLVGPTALVVANREEDTVPYNGGNQLLQEQRQERTTNNGQVKVVDFEKTIERKGRTVAHQLTTAEDDDIVCHQHRRGLLECRHWGAARGESEGLGRVWLDEYEEPLEDGP